MTERLPSRLLLAPDARAAERELLAEVDRAQADDPFARSVVVVPSLELRRQVLARLVEGGRARLGVQVLTLPALAHALLERIDGASPVGPFGVRSADLVFPLLVERLAARERALSSSLATLEDAYAGAALSVRDLLDAGFAATDLAPALEALDAERPRLGEAAIERAQAIVRIAGAVIEELAALGLALESGRQIAAAEALARPDAALPYRRAVLHGFADATGAAALLLERLFSALPTTAILPAPARLDPRAKGHWRFGTRLRERLERTARPEPVPAEEAPTSVELAAASDLDREVAAALARAAAAIDSGIRPERIAIVARDLAPYRSRLEREIDRRAVAASGRSGGEHAAARVARALRELLARRGEATLELVLAAVGPRWEARSGSSAAAIREAALGAGLHRLRELAATPPAHTREAPPLPRLRRLAAELLGPLEELARPQRLGQTVVRMRRILGTAGASLTGPSDGAALERLSDALAELEREPLASMRATADEFSRILDRVWSAAGDRPLGGEGGGVALLSVTEARGLAFDRLLLVGLARDRFPRRIRTDPFLPDALRAALRAAGLTDLPIKAEGHDEERFLFAQLLASAPSIAISWPERDADGSELARSALIDELVRSQRPTKEAARDVESPRAAIDVAIAEALSTGRVGPGFEEAVTEAEARFPRALTGFPAARAAEFRRRVVAEYGADPADAGRRGKLGPYFGFAGGAAAADDAPPWITTLESLAACGWRTFLERLLHLSPPSSPADELPSLPTTLAGNVVHKLLEEIAPAAIRGGELTAALARAPEPVAWPPPAELERLLASIAAERLRLERIDPELFALPLAAEARGLLVSVRDIDWSAGDRLLSGVEATAEAEVPAGDRRRRLRLRIDRVERDPESGAALLVDYKTGRPWSEAVLPETRAAHLERALGEGRLLQLAAYALAMTGDGSPVARLLYVQPDLEPDRREAILRPGDAAAARAPWATIFSAWDAGAFLPRLLDASLQRPFKGCAWCEVRVACVQGDSGARLRLARWAANDPSGSDQAVAGSAESAARALFDLRRKPADEESR